MLKHIVMWKFKDAEGKTKDENIEIVKIAKINLPELWILQILSFERKSYF